MSALASTAPSGASQVGWNDEMDGILDLMSLRGESLADIADTLEVPLAAVQRRLRVLGLVAVKAAPKPVVVVEFPVEQIVNTPAPEAPVPSATTVEPPIAPEPERGTRARAWSSEEEAELRRLSGEGWSATQIGAALGRTSIAVMGRRTVLGIRVGPGRKGRDDVVVEVAMPARRRPPDWTPEEEDRLRELALSGMTTREIAPLIGRSFCAVENRRTQFGLSLPPGPRNRSASPAGQSLVPEPPPAPPPDPVPPPAGSFADRLAAEIALVEARIAADTQALALMRALAGQLTAGAA